MNKSIGAYVLNFSVALYLFSTGILGFSGRRLLPNSNPEIRQAVSSLFRGDLAEVLIVIISILAIAAGVFIILKLFNVDIPVIELPLIILAIVWIVFIIMIDIVAPLNARNKPDFINWLLGFSSHLMVLGGIILSTERFGGR